MDQGITIDQNQKIDGDQGLTKDQNQRLTKIND
jgi:hypothetical protein